MDTARMPPGDSDPSHDLPDTNAHTAVMVAARAARAKPVALVAARAAVAAVMEVTAGSVALAVVVATAAAMAASMAGVVGSRRIRHRRHADSVQ